MMNKQLVANQRSIEIGISCGTISTVAIGISSLVTLDHASRYSGNLLTTLLTFAYLVCGVIICFKRLIKLGKADTPALGKLTLTGLSFSLTVATTGALTHYIKAGYLDAQYAQNALKAAQAKWVADDYTREAIAGQIELTDTFQNPAKWAISSGLFIMFISLVLFFVVGWFNQLRIAAASTNRIDQGLN